MQIPVELLTSTSFSLPPREHLSDAPIALFGLESPAIPPFRLGPGLALGLPPSLIFVIFAGYRRQHVQHQAWALIIESKNVGCFRKTLLEDTECLQECLEFARFEI